MLNQLIHRGQFKAKLECIIFSLLRVQWNLDYPDFFFGPNLVTNIY